MVKKPAVKKPAVKTRKPVVLPKPPLVIAPVNVSAGSDSSWDLSNSGVLSITILMAIGVGFLAWAGWRRLRFQWLGRQYNARQFWDRPEDPEDMQTALRPRLSAPTTPDGSRVTPAADDPVSVARRARRARADTPTGT